MPWQSGQRPETAKLMAYASMRSTSLRISMISKPGKLKGNEAAIPTAPWIDQSQSLDHPFVDLDSRNLDMSRKIYATEKIHKHREMLRKNSTLHHPSALL
jgi:hypothetical protein